MSKKATIRSIQSMFFRTQIILIVALALFLGAAGTLVSLHAENRKRDTNLRNVAETIARSPLLDDDAQSAALTEYLDSLKEALDDIDVISVVDRDSVRLYHSNHELSGTVYDGTLPQFEQGGTAGFYAVDETGPSGRQRRAYAEIRGEDDSYRGFVMAIMLMKNVRSETAQTLLIFALITLATLAVELLICAEISGRIKRSLMGYEPDAFTAMFKMRDNILESLDEGIIAVDREGRLQFANRAALGMLPADLGDGHIGRPLESDGCGRLMRDTLSDGEKHFSDRVGRADILLDSAPIRDDEDNVVGAIGILHDRAEYTRLMEELSGTRYLVDSMRANNHDFTNKLHVILGLIEMGMYDKATAYIQKITLLQRSTVSLIMNAVREPAVAALLIGKTSRASELNISMTLREGCHYSPSDLPLPQEVLVTVIGNLIDNALDAMNDRADYAVDAPRELLVGIFSRPGAVLITVDDTGGGIRPEDTERIFENGYSTKGEGRGTGLYQVRRMVEQLGGSITVESQPGVGSCFTVSFTSKKEDGHVPSSDS